ncbi:MAG TPA: ribbon-helix-helix protein, CopG family [Candidatus Didemnitutus sp.]|nr:ribbon-helix-helix protein, CopG family [Candidatus Didemnitutus sp.]
MRKEKIHRAPLAIQLEVEFLDRLNEPVRDGKARSVSEIIRNALENFDFSNVVVMHPAQLQISVRLPDDVRRTLRRVAKAKHTSIGHLVRAAVESHLPKVEAQTRGQLEMEIAAQNGNGHATPGKGRSTASRRGKTAHGTAKSRTSKGAKKSAGRRGAMTRKRKG